MSTTSNRATPTKEQLLAEVEALTERLGDAEIALNASPTVVCDACEANIETDFDGIFCEGCYASISSPGPACDRCGQSLQRGDVVVLERDARSDGLVMTHQDCAR